MAKPLFLLVGEEAKLRGRLFAEFTEVVILVSPTLHSQDSPIHSNTSISYFPSGLSHSYDNPSFSHMTAGSGKTFDYI